jgi:hypothetical protein
MARVKDASIATAVGKHLQRKQASGSHQAHGNVFSSSSWHTAVALLHCRSREGTLQPAGKQCKPVVDAPLHVEAPTEQPEMHKQQVVTTSCTWKNASALLHELKDTCT